MCGIAGFLGHVRDPQAAIGKMTDTLRHRGPDGGDVWLDAGAGIALGHRRLSIVDLSPNGSQPMHSASGRYVLCFNGEIYNFGELLPELERQGYPFRGHSDTEVLLAAIDLWGVDETLQRINGMFAFALWDRATGTLLLARDRVGKKPLYYGRSGTSFVFGSELKALRAFPGFDGTINRNALLEYVRFGWVPEPLSIYSSASKLSPGCLLRVNARQGSAPPEEQCYWRANSVCHRAWENTYRGSYDNAVEHLDDLLHKAVGTRIIADVELGALLSGGVDSATVTALMQYHSPRPVKTFTIGFREPRFNEAEHAAAIASHLGTDHHELYVTPRQCLDTVEQLPHVYDEPFADISQVPTLLVSALAREQVKVVLSGDGGDELFCGYTRYFEAREHWRMMQMLPAWLRRPVRGLAVRFADASWNFFSHALHDRARLSGWRRTGARLEKRTRGWDHDTPQELLLDHFARHMQPDTLVAGAGHAGANIDNAGRWVTGVDAMLQMRHLDYIGYLPDDILVKVDRASMSVGLEVRAPILDTRVTEFAWSLPQEFLVDADGGKRILRDVMGRYIPKKLTDRPKRGFSPPIEDWLRGPLHDWAQNLLDPGLLASQGYFNNDEVRKIWKQHLAGWRNHSNLLWALLMFQSWLLAVG